MPGLPKRGPNNMLSPVLIIVALIPALVSCRLVNNDPTEYSNDLPFENFTQESDTHDFDYRESEIEERIVTDPTFVERPVESRVTTHERPMIRICCKPGQYLEGSRCNENAAFPADKVLVPEVHDSTPSRSRVRFDVILGIPCKSGQTYVLNAKRPDGYSKEVYHLLEDGTIFVDNSKINEDSYGLSHDSYCFAAVMTENRTITSIAVCFPPMGRDKAIPMIYPIAMGLTSLVVVVNLIVYAICRKRRSFV